MTRTRTFFTLMAVGALAVAPLAAKPTSTAPRAPEPEREGEVAFTVSGQGYAIPIPEGYCRPEGENIAISRQIAAGDTLNLTHAEFDVCGTYGTDYVLVKSPRAMPVVPFTREVFLGLMAEELVNGSALQQGRVIAERDLETMTGGQMEIVNDTYGYAGTDDFCVYMAGYVTVDMPGVRDKAATAACATLIESRNIVVHVFDFTDDAPSLEALRARARALAQTISVR